MLPQGRGSSLITVTVSNGSDLSLPEIKRNHTDTTYPLPSYTLFYNRTNKWWERTRTQGNDYGQTVVSRETSIHETPINKGDTRRDTRRKRKKTGQSQEHRFEHAGEARKLPVL